MPRRPAHATYLLSVALLAAVIVRAVMSVAVWEVALGAKSIIGLG